MPDPDRAAITAALQQALTHAVNALTSTTVAAVAVTAHRLAPGASLWLAGTTPAIHAEQAALASAQQLDDGPVLELWLTSSRGGCAPCGACRQLVLDLETWQRQPITVVSWDPATDYALPRSTGDLLPAAFRSRHLEEAARRA